jgi:acetoacetate decarboxylase
MNIADVKAKAFAIPLTSPSYAPGRCRADMDALRAVVPEPFEMRICQTQERLDRLDWSGAFRQHTGSCDRTSGARGIVCCSHSH